MFNIEFNPDNNLQKTNIIMKTNEFLLPIIRKTSALKIFRLIDIK